MYGFAIAAAVLMTAPVFVSCGDDDDDPKPADKTVDYIKVEYDVDFPDVVYQYCDVTVEYVAANGEVVRVPGTISADFQKEITVPANQAVGKYTVQANVMLKTVYPTVDNDRVYEVGHDLEVDIETYNAGGKRLNFKEEESKSSQRVQGYNLLNYLGNMTTRTYSVSAEYPL